MLKLFKNKVEVIIPTYNRKYDLDKCINTVIKQDYKNKEIIVVDDGSNDGTEQYIKGKYPFVKYVNNKENKGLNFCRNIGVLNSNGEYVLFLDSDIELVNKKQMSNMVKIYKSKLSKKIGSLGGFYEYPENRVKARGWNWNIYFDVKSINSKEVYIDNKKIVLKECDINGGGNLFTKRELIYKKGGFDEFVKGAGTEVEFCLNLKKDGYIHLFGPSIAAKHNKSISERNNIGLKSKSSNVPDSVRQIWHWRNRLRYLIKNYGFIDSIKIFYRNSNLKEDILSIFAFIKQQFLGLRVKDSQEFPNFKEKISALLYKLRMIPDAYIWNILKFRQTIRCRKIDFIKSNRPNKKIVFRVDDVDKLNKTIIRLTNLFIKYDIPASYQIIPNKLDEKLIKYILSINKKVLFDVGQHGFNHEDHWIGKCRLGEFNWHRSKEDKKMDIINGQNILQKEFGSSFIKVFTPPAHIIDEETISILKEERYIGFSAGMVQSKSKFNKIIDKINLWRHKRFLNLSVSMDLIDWKTREFKSLDVLIKEYNLLKNSDFLGIVVHDKFMKEQDFITFEKFIKYLKSKEVDFNNFKMIVENLKK